MQSKAALFHHNLVKIRHLQLQPYRGFSTAPSSKVIFETLSPHLTEIKLNAPRALNAVDTEMVDAMID